MAMRTSFSPSCHDELQVGVLGHLAVLPDPHEPLVRLERDEVRVAHAADQDLAGREQGADRLLVLGVVHQALGVAQRADRCLEHLSGHRRVRIPGPDAAVVRDLARIVDCGEALPHLRVSSVAQAPGQAHEGGLAAAGLPGELDDGEPRDLPGPVEDEIERFALGALHRVVHRADLDEAAPRDIVDVLFVHDGTSLLVMGARRG
jgi:hypothetical protein